MNATGLFAAPTSTPQMATLTDGLGATLGASPDAAVGAPGQPDFAALVAALANDQTAAPPPGLQVAVAAPPGLQVAVKALAVVATLAPAGVKDESGQAVPLIAPASNPANGLARSMVRGPGLFTAPDSASATVLQNLQVTAPETPGGITVIPVTAGITAADTGDKDPPAEESETGAQTAAAPAALLAGLFIGGDVIALAVKSATDPDAGETATAVPTQTNGMDDDQIVLTAKASSKPASAASLDLAPRARGFEINAAAAATVASSPAPVAAAATVALSPAPVAAAATVALSTTPVVAAAAASAPLSAEPATSPSPAAPAPPASEAAPSAEVAALVQQLGGARASIQGRIVSAPVSRPLGSSSVRAVGEASGPTVTTAGLIEPGLETGQALALPSEAAATPDDLPGDVLLAAAEQPADRARTPAGQDSTLQAAMTAASPRAMSDGSSPLLAATPQTVTQLAAAISQMTGAKATRFTVELDPVGLGKVDVKVDINSRGELTAALSFQNPHAAHELRARASELQSALQQAGFDLSRTTLHFNSGEQSGQGLWNQQQQQQQQRQGDAQTPRPGVFGNLADASLAPKTRTTRAGGVDVTI